MANPDPVAVHDAFILICSIWVFCLKFGFAFVEASKTSPQSVSNILFKNTVDTFVTLVAYWLHGYAFAFGQHNSVIGTKFFLSLDQTNMVHFFFNYVRCTVATTLALGAVNERTEPIGYIMSAYVFSGLVYPLACHWVWDSDGIFHPLSSSYPTQDYAGSGVIFLLGGTAGAVALRVIGQRTGRWSPNFRQREYNPSLMVLGSCLQLVGFLGLVLGSHQQLFEPGEGQLLGLKCLNLLLAAASGGLYSLIIERLQHHYYSLESLLSGAIAGMVAVCAGVDTYIPGIAVLCGATGALFFKAFQFLFVVIKTDDTMNVISAYLTPGAWGLVFAGLFSDQGTLSGNAHVLENNFLIVVILLLWGIAVMYPLLSFFMCIGVLRVPRFMEKQGIDKFRHKLRNPQVNSKSLN
ncbi:putative ammonium transporter 1 [Aplochiton taeniatus]